METKGSAAPSVTSPVPEAASVAQVLRYAGEALAAGMGGALATVIQRHGSAPSTPGQKLYWRADGRMFGTIGGGAVEREVLHVLRSEQLVAPMVRVFKLGPELGMCCGGRVELLLEPLVAPQVVLIVGAGHVGRALAPLLSALEFAVTVADPREGVELAGGGGNGDGAEDPSVYPPGAALATMPAGDVIAPRLVRLEFDEAGAGLAKSTAVLVMTHDHQLDQEVLEWAIRREFAFIGGVGSRAKALRTRERLAHKGVATADAERIRMPLGVDIGARSPAEIALAIAGELVAWRSELRAARACGA
jgi:xanthine dehydrogenase accessory factor